MRRKGKSAAWSDRSEGQIYDAAQIEKAGRRAMENTVSRPAREVNERELPHISTAPKGYRVIQSSRGVASLATTTGFYLGLFSTEELT